MEYERKALLRARDTFSPKADIAEVDKFCRELKIPGELKISYPGNGGRSSVTFIEKEQVYDTTPENI
jgi:hypothetical protein